jgi:hypothetical protein
MTPPAAPPAMCSHMQPFRRGFCSSRSYYDGWHAQQARALSTCLELCLNDDQCAFAAFILDQTCSRYNYDAGACADGGSDDHRLFSKQRLPCTPPASPAPPPTQPPSPWPPPVPFSPGQFPTLAIVYHGDYMRTGNKCSVRAPSRSRARVCWFALLEPPRSNDRARECARVILMHGTCTAQDFFANAYNHKVMLVDPLKAMPMRVVTVFHTFSSPCAERTLQTGCTPHDARPSTVRRALCTQHTT